VHHDYRVVGRDSKRGEIAVELAVVKRSIVDSALAICRHWAIGPTRIGIAGDVEKQGEAINFLRASRPGGWSLPAALNSVLAGTAILLAAWALGIAYSNLEVEAAALTSQLEKAKVQSRQADSLRKELERAQSQTGFLARRRDQGSPLEIVHEITQIVDDDGWIGQLQIAGKEVRISGLAPNATQLLSTLGKSELLQNARFRAPVTRQFTGSDRYDISLDIRAGGKP
jgi:Tfp pilus assembly protein PilN